MPFTDALQKPLQHPRVAGALGGTARISPELTAKLLK